jgi:hypothetical protein
VKREDLQRVAQKYLVADRTDILRYPVPAPTKETSASPAK